MKKKIKLRKIKKKVKKILKRPKSKLNFNVMDGDEIIIGSRSQMVRVIGEVNAPGVHRFVPGKRANYYIKLAGGFTMDSEGKNIWIDYPSGESELEMGMTYTQ